VSAQLHIEGNRTFLTLPNLKLDSVPLIEIFDLIAGCEAAAVKENFVAPVIGDDEAEAFLLYNFLYRSCH
jgi:hypothetical protein